MKYLIINLKNFIKNETAIFTLVILCILSSAIIINFAFGFYHHLEEKKLEGESNTKFFGIVFHDEKRNTVTKGSFMDALLSLDDDIFENCTITFNGRFLEDKTEDPVIDNSTLAVCMHFCIKDGIVTTAPLEEAWRENNILMDGNYFTARQVENGELVCLAPPVSYEYSDEQARWAEKYGVNEDGTYTIDGKNYTCIGHVDWFTIIPIVPVTTVRDDCYIMEMGFSYNKTVTRRAYKEITGLIREKYGNLAEIPPLELQEVDSLKFYNTLLVLCILLISMSGLILSMLYQYVLLQRRKQLTIYRMCGMTNRKAKLLYFIECLLLSTVIYILAIVVFHYVLLPYFCRFFEYIAASYTLYSYTILGLMYIGISSVILYVMIWHQMGRNIADELREV